jgi:hypothetical protein
LCQACDCCKNHNWSTPTDPTATAVLRRIRFGASNPNPYTDGVENTTPDKQYLKINGTSALWADGAIAYSVPQSWTADTNPCNCTFNTPAETNYNWVNGTSQITGSGSEVTATFPTTGDPGVKVSCSGSVITGAYRAPVQCQNGGCDATDTVHYHKRLTANSPSQQMAFPISVHTLKLEIKAQSGGSWGESATIGAGGVNSAPHKADVRATLDPADSSASLSFSVAWKPKDGDWGIPWSIANGAEFTLTSGSLIGDGGTLGGQETGATSSVTVSYAHAFDPEPELSVQPDGSLKGDVGVKNDSTGLDGHSIAVVPVSITVQRWDATEEKPVTETRTENLPDWIYTTTHVTTDGSGLAELIRPAPGERVVGATFRVYDNTVWKTVTSSP